MNPTITTRINRIEKAASDKWKPQTIIVSDYRGDGKPATVQTRIVIGTHKPVPMVHRWRQYGYWTPWGDKLPPIKTPKPKAPPIKIPPAPTLVAKYKQPDKHCQPVPNCVARTRTPAARVRQLVPGRLTLKLTAESGWSDN